MTDVRVPREWLEHLIGEVCHGWGEGFAKSEIADEIRALLAADQPAGDEVEVVGRLVTRVTASGDPKQTLLGPKQPEPRFYSTKEPLMTVSQHEAILAAALAAK